MDAAELKRLEQDIDKRVEDIRSAVEMLEWRINQQPDTTQRHTDQRYIHDIVSALDYLKSDRQERTGRLFA